MLRRRKVILAVSFPAAGQDKGSRRETGVGRSPSGFFSAFLREQQKVLHVSKAMGILIWCLELVLNSETFCYTLPCFAQFCFVFLCAMYFPALVLSSFLAPPLDLCLVHASAIFPGIPYFEPLYMFLLVC